jgi:hypothetical protein
VKTCDLLSQRPQSDLGSPGRAPQDVRQARFPFLETHGAMQLDQGVTGITGIHLRAKVEALGFRLQFVKNCGPFGHLEHFENYASVFGKWAAPQYQRRRARPSVRPSRPISPLSIAGSASAAGGATDR